MKRNKLNQYFFYTIFKYTKYNVLLVYILIVFYFRVKEKKKKFRFVPEIFYKFKIILDFEIFEVR